MATVLGIGGIFMKSPNPEQLRNWYRDMLGLELEPWGGVQFWSKPEKSAALSPTR